MRRPEPWVRCLASSLLYLLASGLWVGTQAQVVRDSLRFDSDTLRLSAVNLAPGSDTLFVGGATVPRSAYRLLLLSGQLVLLDPALRGQRAQLRYRSLGPVMRVAVPLPGIRRGAAESRSPVAVGSAPTQVASSEPDVGSPLFDDVPRLERSGSIGRSITLGSNRDLAVNSDFRLQLSGRLTDDLEIAAALTDENIPIQPSGNTQQLADFDRIFIQLKQRNRYLTFGDLEAIQRGTSFANVYRNVQGLAYRTEGPRRTFATIANARGRFHTNSFVGENGRQGPYRLQGRDGERFMVVLAGSERVMINGRQVVRGEARDYVIDYNTAEITFTPRLVIDANTRIVVDFEYAVQQYARSLLLFAHEGRYAADRLGVRLSLAREADDPDAPLNAALSPRDREALADGGDLGAIVPGVDSVGYSPLEVRYVAVDTIINGQPLRFYRRSLDPLTAIYRLTFTAVGSGRGNYVRDASLVNGNVFRFVGPDASGRPQGDFEPIRRLATPKLLQVGMASVDWRATKHLSVFNETAVSSYDQNRLSSRDDADNVGLATRGGLRLSNLALGEKTQLSAEAVGQYVDAQFENLDRVYRFEYGRDWNFNDLAPRGIERLGELSAEMRNSRGYRLRLAGGLRSMGDSVRTQRVTVEAESSDSSALMGRHLMVWLATDNPLARTRSTWLRHNGDLYALVGPRRREWLRLGTEIWIERRTQTQGDSLTLGSFDFVDLKPYLRSLPGRRVQFELASTLRSDREFLAAALRDKAVTLKPSLSVSYTSPKLTSSLTATYLDYRLRDTAFARVGLGDQRALQSLLQLGYTAPSRFWQANAFYEVSTERIARRQLVYVKVNPGLGQYDWIDYNNNGVEDLNEFELSPNPLTANYIRVLSPTALLIPTVRAVLGTNLRFDFGRLIADGSGWLRHVLHHLSSQSNFRLDQRRSAPTDELQSYLVQFGTLARADSTLLSAIASFRQDLFFFRNNRVGDFSFSLLTNQNLQFLNSGSEERSSTTWQARQRLNFDTRRSLDNLVQVGNRRSRAELLFSRNYDIRFISVQPAFNWQTTRRTRLSLGYEYALRRLLPVVNEQNAGPEPSARLSVHKLIADARFSYGQRNNLSSRLELVSNGLEGVPLSSARFELLEGLQPGRNVVWNLMLVQYLSRVLEFSVVYDGRAAANVSMLHSARIQLRALF